MRRSWFRLYGDIACAGHFHLQIGRNWQHCRRQQLPSAEHGTEAHCHKSTALITDVCAHFEITVLFAVKPMRKLLLHEALEFLTIRPFLRNLEKDQVCGMA